MRWILTAMIVLGMAFSGCVGEDPDDPGSEVASDTRRASSPMDEDTDGGIPGDEQADREILTFNGTYSLVAQQVRTPIAGTGINENNCVHLTGTGLEILNGTAIAQWDADTSLAEEMELYVIGEDWTVSGQQSSPIELELENVRVYGGDISIFLQTGAPGITIDQAFTLELHLSHVGTLQDEDDWSCIASGS